MKDLIKFLIAPLSVFWILLIFGYGFKFINKRRISLFLLVVSGIWLVLISTKFLPIYLISSLEDNYRSIETDSILVHSHFNIMVLGGGYSDDTSLPPNDQVNCTTLGRLSEGLRLYRLFPGSKLVTGDYDGRMIFSQAVSISNTAIALGVNESDIITIKLTSNNTNGEAEAYFREFGNSNQLILVTDAIHMPRAMMLFKRAELNPVPAPTNHIIKHGSVKDHFSWLPSISNIGRMEAAMHESLGILWSRMGGE
jgi:uncharacterized SAM-binding protein YcdF (DUF218 family)